MGERLPEVTISVFPKPSVGVIINLKGAFAYEDYGYPYCLATTIFNTGISCPIDYSEGEIKRIEKTEKNLPETQEEKKPNILFLQLESFFDPTLVKYLNISEDPIPTFRKLMEDYSSGYYKVPSVGAGTANTEFESITGMSMHYFGPGEYPYKSILRETTCESAPYVLKNLGYSTHAVHNNEAHKGRSHRLSLSEYSYRDTHRGQNNAYSYR